MMICRKSNYNKNNKKQKQNWKKKSKMTLGIAYGTKQLNIFIQVAQFFYPVMAAHYSDSQT